LILISETVVTPTSLLSTHWTALATPHISIVVPEHRYYGTEYLDREHVRPQTLAEHHVNVDPQTSFHISLLMTLSSQCTRTPATPYVRLQHLEIRPSTLPSNIHSHPLARPHRSNQPHRSNTSPLHPYLVYTLHTCNRSSNSTWRRGSSALPPSIPPFLTLAIQKLDYCDIAVFILLPYISCILQSLRARADWLVVSVLARFLNYCAD
jgi:hypothetical protein